MPSRRRALALVLALLLVPLAAGQPTPPSTPGQVECQQPIETCLPDLIVSNVQVENVDERHPTRICAGFINVGTGPVATPFRVLLELDGVPTAEHQVSGTYRGGEGKGDLCWSDLMLVRGRHNATIVVDYREEVPEENERNNRRSYHFDVRARPQVDLVLAQLVVLPPVGGENDTQLFIVNVTNAGGLPSEPTTVLLQDDHGLMANWSLPALAAGERKTFVHPTRPALRPVGTFVARATVDPDDLVHELSETNNAALAQYTVLEHPAPDYVISNITITGNMTERRGIRVDVHVQNVGDLAVRGTIIRLFNSTNATVGQGVTRTVIAPGGVAVVQFYAALRAGDHTLRVMADPTDIVPERNESNNDRSITFTIIPAETDVDLPNLLVERIYAMPDDPRPREMVSVGALVRNLGTNVSRPTTIHFSIDGEHIGSAPVPALQPEAYHSAYVPWAGGEPKLYRIVARVDPGNEIVELEDGDNALEREFLVTTQRAPEPPAPTPPTEEPPTPPTDPGPATPSPRPPANDTTTPVGPRVVLGELIISTRAVPGGVKGVVSATIRNPTMEPVTNLAMDFKVDGKHLLTRLHPGLAGAASGAISTGEIDLPEGKHTITAELRVLGSNEPALSRDKEYEQAGEKSGIPAPGWAAGLLLVAAVALLRRR